MESSPATKTMSTSELSKHVRCKADLYRLALRNGYYLPKEKSAAVNELMLLNII